MSSRLEKVKGLGQEDKKWSKIKADILVGKPLFIHSCIHLFIHSTNLLCSCLDSGSTNVGNTQQKQQRSLPSGGPHLF